jgi:phosphoribosylamine--glycine ligase
MQRLRSDLTALCLATAKNELQAIELDWDPRSALAVVLAAGGYPFDYAKGEVISGLAQDHGSDCKVFHAGTTKHGEDIVTAGGRVLSVSALGDDIAQAQARAYQAVATITWPDVYFRHDIGHRAIAAEQ